MLVTSQLVWAEEAVNVTLPDFKISINELAVDNSKQAYPFISYNAVTYVPMTWDFASALGLYTEWSGETGLTVRKAENVGTPVLVNSAENNMSEIYQASLVDFPVTIGGKTVVNEHEEYPVLSFRGVTYLPLTWKYVNEAFGGESTWSNEEGLKISVARDGFDLSNLKTDEPNVFEETFTYAEISENIYGITDLIAFTQHDAENQIVSIYTNKFMELHGYYYDIMISYYDANGEKIYNVYEAFGQKYLGDGSARSSEMRYGITYTDITYDTVQVTVKMYAPELFTKMNEEIEQDYKVEYISAASTSNKMFIDDGITYVTGAYLGPSVDRELCLYTAKHNEELILPDGKAYEVRKYNDGGITFKLQEDTYWDVDTYQDIIINADGKLVTIYEGEEHNNTNGDAILGFNEDKELVKIYINVDSFDD